MALVASGMGTVVIGRGVVLCMPTLLGCVGLFGITVFCPKLLFGPKLFCPILLFGPKLF